jgi:hypothetical protein
MPHPLRRLPFTFHLGLFPVALVLWAWADSIKHFTSWDSGPILDPARWVRSSDSGITFGHTTSTPSADPMRMLYWDAYGDSVRWVTSTPLLEGRFGKILRYGNYNLRQSWFPPFRSTTEIRESEYEPNDLTIRSWVIPYWLILLTYLPLWLVLVLAHARHRRGKLATSADLS